MTDKSLIVAQPSPVIMSDSIAELATALAVAQLVIPTAEKNKRNPHFNSNYADLESVMNACRIPLAENGLSIIQIPGATGTKETITGKLQGSQVIEVKETIFTIEMTTILVHASGQYIGGTVSLPIRKGDTNNAGSGLSYARRYGASAIIALVTGEDDDGNTASQPQKKKATRKSSPQKVKAETIASTIRGVEPLQTDPEGRAWPPKSQPAPQTANLPAAKLKALHATGSGFYGKEWDNERPKLVEWATGGRVTSSKDMTPVEADKLIRGINRKADAKAKE